MLLDEFRGWSPELLALIRECGDRMVARLGLTSSRWQVLGAVFDAERELSRQAEAAYRRLVSDWRSSGRPRTGAGHDTGARISRPSKGKAARQTP